MEHFWGCQVPVGVVEQAAAHARLDILQVLAKHDAALRGRGAPSRKKRRVETGRGRIPGNVVEWGGQSMVRDVYNHHYGVVKFLFGYTSRDVYADTLATAIGCLLNSGEVDLAEELLPPGRSVLDYPGNARSIHLLSSADLRLRLTIVLEKLVESGRLDLMKKIWEKHQLGAMQHWVQGMSIAGKIGNLAMLRWMVEHTSGRATLKKCGASLLLYRAAYGNRLGVMQYLYEQDATTGYGEALLCAIFEDNMDAVKWLVEHFPRSETFPEYARSCKARTSGNIGILTECGAAKAIS